MSHAVQVAKDAASAGGAVLRDKMGSVTGVRSKSAAIDLVSDVDIASGVAIAKALMEADPGASLIVEEPEVYELLGISPGSLDDERTWVVDPLDGTTSYLHAYPFYSVSVALLESGRPVAGAVYNAASDEMHWASEGEGAFWQGRRIHCTPTPSVFEALVVTGFPYDRGAPLDLQLSVLTAFLRAPVHGMRRDGSAALDCCHVAAGRADGYWEYTLLPWDLSAGVVICREAGAKVTDISGADWHPASGNVLVANPELHARMLEIVLAASGA
jgi:myo-inositol-1(or 4)-monophosphatase